MVAAGLAKKCEVQVAYAIGMAEPTSIRVDTFGTSNIQEQDIEAENNSGELECKDGTFLLPKLNKTEIAPKEVYKSKGIKIDLRHHNFENEPLPTDDECISKNSMMCLDLRIRTSCLWIYTYYL